VISLAVPLARADFGVGDLAGPWQLHGLISGDNPDQHPGWFWMSLEFDADGNASATSTIHDSLGNTDYSPTLQGFAFDRFGHLTYEGIDSFQGTMSIDKDLIVTTVTLAPGAYEDVRGYNLHVYTRAGSGFTTADLAGTWYGDGRRGWDLLGRNLR
jgi:hypothetical protein